MYPILFAGSVEFSDRCVYLVSVRTKSPSTKVGPALDGYLDKCIYSVPFTVEPISFFTLYDIALSTPADRLARKRAASPSSASPYCSRNSSVWHGSFKM